MPLFNFFSFFYSKGGEILKLDTYLKIHGVQVQCFRSYLLVFCTSVYHLARKELLIIFFLYASGQIFNTKLGMFTTCN